MKKFLTFLASLGLFSGSLKAEIPPTKPLVIVLLGPPGAGKGTHATRLSKELRLPHISTGDLFRKNLKNKTEIGKKAQSYIERGQLVPDEIVAEMLFKRISQQDCKKGYILDGFPRNLNQANLLSKKITPIVINFRAKDDLLIKRISGRLTCKNCGALYHKNFLPPQKKGICDSCSGELYQRPDDKEEIIKNRLEVYHKETEPLVALYREKKLLIDINAEESKDKVFQDLVNVLFKN